MRTHQVCAIGAALAGCFLGCNSSNTSPSPAAPPGPPGQPGQPGATPATFTQVLTTVLGPHCNSCHTPPNASAGLDFTTWDSIVHNTVRANLVVPGDPNQSLLFQDIQGGMAPGSTETLTQDEIQMVFSWIQSGAPDN